MKQRPLAESHLGQADETRQIGSITQIEAAFAPNVLFNRHSHKNACFTLIRQGGYSESFGPKVFELKPHSVVFRPPEESHSNKFGSSPVNCSLFEIDATWFDNLQGRAKILAGPMLFQNGHIVWQTMALLKEFVEPDDVSVLIIDGLTMEMVAGVSRRIRTRPHRDPPRWLICAKSLLEDEFSNRLSLDHIANTAGVHPAYLANTFRDFFHCSVGEYIRKLRIDSACRQLSSSRSSLVEIALNVGFSSQSHFASTFKRLTGETPAKYRSIFRKS